MRNSKAGSKIDSLNIVRIELEPGISTELSATATVGLLDSSAGPNLLGKSIYKGPWPAKTLKLINELRDEMESNLLSVYFVRNDDPARSSNNKPTSIIDPELGPTSSETPQL